MSNEPTAGCNRGNDCVQFHQSKSLSTISIQRELSVYETSEVFDVLSKSISGDSRIVEVLDISARHVLAYTRNDGHDWTSSRVQHETGLPTFLDCCGASSLRY